MNKKRDCKNYQEDFFTSRSDSKRGEFGVEDGQLYGSRHLPSINDAAMTSFSVDYETEGAPAFHKNASPVSTIINMTFTESKIYTRDSVRKENNLYD